MAGICSQTCAGAADCSSLTWKGRQAREEAFYNSGSAQRRLVEEWPAALGFGSLITNFPLTDAQFFMPQSPDPPAGRTTVCLGGWLLAGLGGALSPAGYGEARVRLMLGGAVLGGAVGLTATTELAVLLAVIGAAAGWRALPWAVKRRSCRRAEAMECDLSEMLDVVALGMRSGMSFDRSLDLYTGYFRTQLADAFRSAQRQWACGLASRPEALREVADSYASPLLARVIENIVRSLRFGATMADNLEDAAREARSGYKARRQEAVAKAPVKMMVPTGVLILPAMLMLVLGPVLLELAGGF